MDTVKNGLAWVARAYRHRCRRAAGAGHRAEVGQLGVVMDCALSDEPVEADSHPPGGDQPPDSRPVLLSHMIITWELRGFKSLRRRGAR